MEKMTLSQFHSGSIKTGVKPNILLKDGRGLNSTMVRLKRNRLFYRKRRLVCLNSTMVRLKL